MTTTENNVAAQAGDEPMRADFEREVLRLGIIDDEGLERRHDGSYVDDPAQAAWLTWKAAQVLPRATADVERDAARYRWLRERPYSDWKRIAFNTMDDHPFAIRCRDEEIDAAIATTKPGA